MKNGNRQQQRISLFDGKSTTGWHTYGQQQAGQSWKARDGILFLEAHGNRDWQGRGGGDIVTDRDFENFDFEVEWNISPGGNSGIMFYVMEDPSRFTYTWHSGPEIQLLDNAAHKDAAIYKHRAGDLYDLIAVSKDTVKSANEWNKTRIVAVDGKLEIYLNDERVIETTLWNEAWQGMIANSKFRAYPGFGTFRKGKIALQDHGSNVSFRNITISEL